MLEHPSGRIVDQSTFDFLHHLYTDNHRKVCEILLEKLNEKFNRALAYKTFENQGGEQEFVAYCVTLMRLKRDGKKVEAEAIELLSNYVRNFRPGM